jgi:transposase-like protein
MVWMLAKHFRDEEAACAFLESRRWPDGVICPHCETPGETTRFHSSRDGIFKCNACERQFSVTVGTVFERSRIPLHKWLLAVQMFCTQPDGVKILDLQRALGVSYRTAWRVRQRILYALTQMSSHG